MVLDDLPPEYIAILRQINAGRRNFGPADHTNPADVRAAEELLGWLEAMRADDLVREIKTHYQKMTDTAAGDLFNVTPLLSEQGLRLAQDLKRRDAEAACAT